jgi:hypothetical protein
MLARFWFLLFYVLLGLPLSLWTGDWAWMGWALPIAIGGRYRTVTSLSRSTSPKQRARGATLA